jgi:crotonobetainyl-CoA:carnitine CoA-transferase CaiB-like acyl-CoA transferase
VGDGVAGPMAGVRVVELGVWIAGPAAAGVLADWGADVIKIEPLAGDPARGFQRMLGGDMPNNPVFELDNRSKRSIVVDLTTPDGLAIALELIDVADVFVTNVRADALERLGLGPATLLARRPRLVYGHLSGYGRDGDDANRAAFDIAAFWARSGIASLLTAPGGTLPFQRGGMGDHSTGVQFAGALSAALFSRERTGEGQLVSSSLLRQGVYTIGFDLNMVLGWGLHPAIGDRRTMANPCINNYTAGDGRQFWIVGLEGDRHWPPLVRSVGRPEWLDDPRFLTAGDRAENAAALILLLDAEFATRSLADWAEVFATEPDMFWAPVNTPADILEDPQLRDAGGLVEVPDGSGTTTMIASPADFHGTPWAPRSLAPTLGQHTAEVLRGLGRTAEDIAALVADGTVTLGI